MTVVSPAFRTSALLTAGISSQGLELKLAGTGLVLLVVVLGAGAQAHSQRATTLQE